MTVDLAAGADDGRPYSLATHARRQPDKPAIIMGASGEVLTYADLDRRANRLARLFADTGCRPGDHVALMMENHPCFAEVCWAAYRSGLHYTPVNWHLTPAEAAYIVEDCGARVVVGSAWCASAAELPSMVQGDVRWLMVGEPDPGWEAYPEAVAAYDAGALEVEIEGAAMLYSSGTTGRPKGVVRPLPDRDFGTSIFGVDPAMAPALGLRPDTVTLIPTPLYHSLGLTRLMMSTAIGATVILMERFTAEASLALIERYRVTMASWVPTILIRLLRLPSEVRSRYDLSSMTVCNFGSGPCPAWVKPAMIEWWGPILSETYGGTEGMGLTAISSAEMLARPTSVGRAVFGEVHVLREDGTEAEPGESGIVYFAGGRPFEYHNDPGKTAAARNERGWATLWDIGHVDAEGYLYITDRAADVIVSGGVNIYPREVEEILLAHPEVDDVAVIGVPNEEMAEEVKAIVKPASGCIPDDLLARRLIEHCRGRLAGFKCPRTVDFVDQLPRQATGKLAKRLLREPYWRGRESNVV